MPRALHRVPVVRHHDDRLAHLGVQAPQQGEDFPRALAVEVAGRLVGDDDRGVGDEGARDGHALLLAAGELVGVVLHAVREAHERERHLDPLAPFAARERGEQERQLHVLERVQHRHQVVELEHEADVGGSPVREFRFRELGDVLAAHQQLPCIRLVDARDQVEECRFSRSRRAHERDEVALGNAEGDVEQHGHSWSPRR